MLVVLLHQCRESFLSFYVIIRFAGFGNASGVEEVTPELAGDVKVVPDTRGEDGAPLTADGGAGEEGVDVEVQSDGGENLWYICHG